jgi:hypothetical protein
MKKLEELTTPDFTNTLVGLVNSLDGTGRNAALADFYQSAERIQISKTTPEHVRSYMEAVKTLFAYGWFYYPFFTLSAFMATTAVELALRLRLQKRRNDHSGLKALFDEGIRQGLLKDEGFPSREAVREINAAMFGQDGESPEALPSGNVPSYAETVAEWMRYFRNVFAHPSGHWILFPGQAINFLTLAGEVINQLWPGEPPGSVGDSDSAA